MIKTAIIGTGLIGQAWAIVFARAGCQTILWDGNYQAAQKALELIALQLEDLQQNGLVSEPAAILQNIRVVQHLDEALEDAKYVQENLPENRDVKRAIYKEMDALAPPGTILASSTSSIPASEFTQDLNGRHRCLVAHPVNPPYLIPAVEICGAPWTSEQTIAKTRQIMNQVKQKPVVIHKELEGFILNRLQGALLREAYRLVELGYVSVEDLDVTIKDGLGLRWAFMGPFETIDLNAPNGIKEYSERYGPLFQSISKEQTSTESWSESLITKLENSRREQLPNEQLLQRRLWRDKQLMALLKHKQKQSL